MKSEKEMSEDQQSPKNNALMNENSHICRIFVKAACKKSQQYTAGMQSMVWPVD